MKKSKQKTYDILAGIPSFNDQDTISYVVEQIGKSMEKYYKNKNCIIVDCDGGSTDDTLKKFLNSKTSIEKRIIKTLPPMTGKGAVFRLLFKLVKKLNVPIAIVNDSDLRSINPKWVKLQIDSIKKYDYATPYYSRYKYDGQITNHLCYPLIYGLFCKDIRQPIGGDFAFSSKLSNYWLKCKWPVNAKLFGIDIFMTTNAILNRSKICQLNLGAKIHDAKDPGKSLGPMFRQVISTLFKIILENKNKLKNFKKVGKVALLGSNKLLKPQEFDIDVENMKKIIILQYKKNKEIIKKCLPKDDFEKLRRTIIYGEIYLGHEWWTKMVYDYILAYKKYEKMSNTILESFTPLWFARIYTFINETIDMNTKEAEVLIKKQAKEFFKQRDYLLDKL